MTRQYVLQVEFGDDTKLVKDEDVFVHHVRSAAHYYATLFTGGSIPQVQMIRVLDKEQADLFNLRKNER